MRKRLALLIVALFMLVGCDHATKHWAESTLRNAPRIEVLGGMIDLQYAANRGAAFSFLGNVPTVIRTPFFITVGVIATVALAVTWYRRRNAPLFEQSAYLLFMAGALGNWLDRVLRGYVVDFIHVHHYSVFNVADAFIVVGVAFYLLSRRSSPADPDDGRLVGPVQAKGIDPPADVLHEQQGQPPTAQHA